MMNNVGSSSSILHSWMKLQQKRFVWGTGDQSTGFLNFGNSSPFFRKKCHFTGRVRGVYYCGAMAITDFYYRFITNHNYDSPRYPQKALVDKALPDDLLYVSTKAANSVKRNILNTTNTCCSPWMHTHGRWSWNSRFKRNAVAFENKCAQLNLRNRATT
jgi:hypothetical protein